jgi:UDP-glucose 4-epimerase
MSSKPSVLLTGGAGYIGSHTYLALLQAGLKPVILDDFSNSSPLVIDRLEHISGAPVLCVAGTVADGSLVRSLINRFQIEAVVHFAGFKAVGESVAQPLKYFENNLGGAVKLLQAMDETACRTLVFSSSATVYGDPASVPINEDFPRSHTNPYGHTKLVIEDLLRALFVANPAWRIGVLRYFNPVGAHPSGLIGEDPCGVPNNLMPYVAQVAVGKQSYLKVYGNDYPTHDGTGVRDYIHVQDLASGHLAALQALLGGSSLTSPDVASGFTINLGTGQGCSVLDVVQAYEKASGREVPYKFAPRREGDVAACYANPSLAKKLLGWQARHTLAEMCQDSWRWQSLNPDGYR